MIGDVCAEYAATNLLLWLLLLPLPGEEVIVIAVGADYTTWEGGRDPVTGQARIGLSYDKLCRDVKPGGRILLADGSCSVQVWGGEGRGGGGMAGVLRQHAMHAHTQQV
jgi:pyruvate kinase